MEPKQGRLRRVMAGPSLYATLSLRLAEAEAIAKTTPYPTPAHLSGQTPRALRRGCEDGGFCSQILWVVFRGCGRGAPDEGVMFGELVGGESYSGNMR